MRIYIDDIREPKTEDFDFVVRTYEEGVAVVEQHGMPEYVSFDHDLGEDENGNELKSGYDFAKYLVDRDLDSEHKLPENFDFNVHSANPVGRKNIESLLNSYLKHKILYVLNQYTSELDEMKSVFIRLSNLLENDPNNAELNTEVKDLKLKIDHVLRDKEKATKRLKRFQ